MSKALMCDRCHKTFDPYFQGGQMVKFRNPIIYTSECVDKGRELSHIDSTVFQYMGRDDHADLCPHCTARFLKFFAENTEPNTEKDGV